MLLWIVAFRPEPLWWGDGPGRRRGALADGALPRRRASFVAVVAALRRAGDRLRLPLAGAARSRCSAASAAVAAWVADRAVRHRRAWCTAGCSRSSTASMLPRGHRPHPLTSAALWVACESLVPRLFPWMAGHGAVDVPPLRRRRSGAACRRVSFVTLCLVVPVYEALRWAFPLPGRPPGAAAPRRSSPSRSGSWRCRPTGCVRYGAGARARSARRPSACASGSCSRTSGASRKRAAESARARRARRVREAYRRGSRRAAAQGAELIVWPETAITDSVPYRDVAVADQRRSSTRAGYGVLERAGRRPRLPRRRVREDSETESPLPDGPLRDERYNVAALRGRGDAQRALDDLPQGLPDPVRRGDAARACRDRACRSTSG